MLPTLAWSHPKFREHLKFARRLLLASAPLAPVIGAATRRIEPRVTA